jgi:hypothetical protein
VKRLNRIEQALGYSLSWANEEAPVWSGPLNWTMLGYSICVAVLFFKQRRTFPRFYIGLLAGSAILGTVDYAWGASIPFIAEELDSGDLRQMTRGWMACLIWIPYMLLSKRVRATFVR